MRLKDLSQEPKNRLMSEWFIYSHEIFEMNLRIACRWGALEREELLLWLTDWQAGGCVSLDQIIVHTFGRLLYKTGRESCEQRFSGGYF